MENFYCTSSSRSSYSSIKKATSDCGMPPVYEYVHASTPVLACPRPVRPIDVQQFDDFVKDDNRETTPITRERTPQQPWNALQYQTSRTRTGKAPLPAHYRLNGATQQTGIQSALYSLPVGHERGHGYKQTESRNWEQTVMIGRLPVSELEREDSPGGVFLEQSSSGPFPESLLVGRPASNSRRSFRTAGEARFEPSSPPASCPPASPSPSPPASPLSDSNSYSSDKMDALQEITESPLPSPPTSPLSDTNSFSLDYMDALQEIELPELKRNSPDMSALEGLQRSPCISESRSECGASTIADIERYYAWRDRQAQRTPLPSPHLSDERNLVPIERAHRPAPIFRRYWWTRPTTRPARPSVSPGNKYPRLICPCKKRGTWRPHVHAPAVVASDPILSPTLSPRDSELLGLDETFRRDSVGYLKRLSEEPDGEEHPSKRRRGAGTEDPSTRLGQLQWTLECAFRNAEESRRIAEESLRVAEMSRRAAEMDAAHLESLLQENFGSAESLPPLRASSPALSDATSTDGGVLIENLDHAASLLSLRARSPALSDATSSIGGLLLENMNRAESLLPSRASSPALADAASDDGGVLLDALNPAESLPPTAEEGNSNAEADLPSEAAMLAADTVRDFLALMAEANTGALDNLPGSSRLASVMHAGRFQTRMVLGKVAEMKSIAQARRELEEREQRINEAWL